MLSFIVGLTDIDPFILSLLGGTYPITDIQLIDAMIIAAGSNNVMKALYTIILGRNRYTVMATIWLIFLFILSLLYVFVLS